MRFTVGLGLCLMLLIAVGCRQGVSFLRADQQRTIDRSVVDYPPSFELKEFANNLNCPSAISFDADGTLFIAEGGMGGQPIHIFGKRIDGSLIEIYPRPTKVPFLTAPIAGFKIYGPVGGLAAGGGKVFVSHRDVNDMGVITAFNYDGTHSTVVSEFPAQGEHGITDITIRPGDGRLYFGVGSATNSGVVGIDDWLIGWLKKHPAVCDIWPVDLKLYGLKFYSKNPLAGFWGGDLSVTAPFQAFGTSDRTRIKKAVNGKGNSAIYSISPTGGDLELLAYGVRYPRGLGYDGYSVFATNDGMELRGTRPVKDDPDALLKISPDTFAGFPDYSTDMTLISDERFQPPASMMKNGYPDNNPLIDRENSNLPRKLLSPSREQLRGIFPTLSGAAKFDFIPGTTTLAPYRRFRGQAIVALSGDRAPFATSGMPLTGPVSYKVVSVNTDDRKVEDFIFNTKGGPASKLGRNVVALERPCDVKLGPDGALYVLDMGHLEVKNGKEKISPRTGRIFKLVPIIEPERPAVK